MYQVQLFALFEDKVWIYRSEIPNLYIPVIIIVKFSYDKYDKDSYLHQLLEILIKPFYGVPSTEFVFFLC